MNQNQSCYPGRDRPIVSRKKKKRSAALIDFDKSEEKGEKPVEKKRRGRGAKGNKPFFKGREKRIRICLFTQVQEQLGKDKIRVGKLGGKNLHASQQYYQY